MDTKNLQKVKYKVTDAFGDSSIGDIVDVFLIQRDPDIDRAILYARPKGKRQTCGCYMICDLENGYWVNHGVDNWVNC